MRKSLFLGFAVVAGVSAHAQLAYTGHTIGETYVDHCLTTYGVRSANVDMGPGAGGTFTIHQKGHVDALLERTAVATPWSHRSYTQYAFSVGATPVQLNHYFGDQRSLNGKIVLGGGSPLNTATTMDLDFGYSLYEYVDANGDGLYQSTEDKFSVSGGSMSIAGPLAGNSLEVYTHNSGEIGSAYILGANRTYIYELSSTLSGITSNSTGSPYFVATHEYGAPYTGWDVQFSYQAVPEPGTVAGLGTAALALVARRRRKS